MKYSNTLKTLNLSFTNFPITSWQLTEISLIKPEYFEQNTEIVEDCKARFEDNLQKKSEWTSRELEKLSSRVQELEELGEIANVQQYTYVII